MSEDRAVTDVSAPTPSAEHAPPHDLGAMIRAGLSHDEASARFRWRVPDRYNIGVDACDRPAAANPGAVAILEVDGQGRVTPATFGELREASNRLASTLAARGVGAGDRVAILLPQSIALPVAHFAAYKLGAIALPLASLFGADALEHRLADSGARALVTDGAGLAKVAPLRAGLPALEVVISTDGPDAAAGAIGFADALAAGAPDLTPLDTSADDPALMIYTSGTTGRPKGALHAHRVLLGHEPGVALHHGGFPEPGDRLWTPADWAWAGGLLNVLLPGLRAGATVVARKFEKFDPEAAFDLMARLGVRNAFVPPTALRMLRAVPNPRGRFDLSLRTIGSGGEALGAETLAWGREALGLTIAEFYGQTECNLVVSAAPRLGVVKPGAIGKPVPGHVVGVIREDGSLAEPGEVGQIAVRRPDPVMFLRYWNNEDATAAKFVGDWMTTGDQGVRDAEGFVSFFGRDDDVITSAGYRIGPVEIEDCLLTHPAVGLAAVVGKPDAVRTEIVKAFIVPKPGFAPDGEAAREALAASITAHVRTRLSAHEYPREIEFRDALPLTTTGKIVRRLLRSDG